MDKEISFEGVPEHHLPSHILRKIYDIDTPEGLNKILYLSGLRSAERAKSHHVPRILTKENAQDILDNFYENKEQRAEQEELEWQAFQKYQNSIKAS